VRTLGWILVILGLLLLWPLGGLVGLLLGLLLLVLALVLAPLALVLAVLLLPLVLVLALGAALVKILWPLLFIAAGIWLIFRERGDDAD